jgi:hypothetical protein
VYELRQQSQRLLTEPVRWRTGRCPSFGEDVAYAALADIVKAEAGILDTDTSSPDTRRGLCAAARIRNRNQST